MTKGFSLSTLILLPPVIPDDVWLKLVDISHILLPVYKVKCIVYSTIVARTKVATSHNKN